MIVPPVRISYTDIGTSPNYIYVKQSLYMVDCHDMPFQ